MWKNHITGFYDLLDSYVLFSFVRIIAVYIYNNFSRLYISKSYILPQLDYLTK